jgi:hypothetical protein
MNTPMTLPIEAIRVGHCIDWEDQGACVEMIEPDMDDGFAVTLRFDGAWEDVVRVIPYGTKVRLTNARQAIEAGEAYAREVAAKHADTLASFDTAYPIRRSA